MYVNSRNSFVIIIRHLLKEIDTYDDKNEDANEGGRRIKNYRKTSMNKSIYIFEQFLHKLQSSFKKNDRLAVSDAKMEF